MTILPVIAVYDGALLGLALIIWIFWNVLEVIYRGVMITGCAIAYAVLTIWEWSEVVVGWTLVKPLMWLVARK